MNTGYSWSIETEPKETDLSRIMEGVISFGRATANSDARPLACLVKEKDQLIAGVTGRTEFDRLFIQYIWVEEQYRGQGIGSQLLEMIENTATARGCIDALIETLSDETADMYKKRGYKPLAVVPKYVGRFTKYILLKAII